VLRFEQTNSPTFAKQGDVLKYIKICATSLRWLIF